MGDLLWKLRLAGEEWKAIGDDESHDLVTQAADEIARLREEVKRLREPTPAMIEAGVKLALSATLSGDYTWPEYIADLYRAMIAAAGEST